MKAKFYNLHQANNILIAHANSMMTFYHASYEGFFELAAEDVITLWAQSEAKIVIKENNF